MTKVLLVEDNEMNRDMLSRRLTRRGFQVVCAVDGQQGVDLARSENPDIILMDMSLPVLDGWEAATAKKRSRPGVTITTPSRSISTVCSRKSSTFCQRVKRPTDRRGRGPCRRVHPMSA